MCHVGSHVAAHVVDPDVQVPLVVDAGDEQVVAYRNIRAVTPRDHLHFRLQDRGYLGEKLRLLGGGGLLRGRVLGDLLLEIGDGGCIGAGKAGLVVLGLEVAVVVEDLDVQQIGAVGTEDHQVLTGGGEARVAGDFNCRCGRRCVANRRFGVGVADRDERSRVV